MQMVPEMRLLRMLKIPPKRAQTPGTRSQEAKGVKGECEFVVCVTVHQSANCIPRQREIVCGSRSTAKYRGFTPALQSRFSKNA